jgi:hypothetical protein
VCTLNTSTKILVHTVNNMCTLIVKLTSVSTCIDGGSYSCAESSESSPANRSDMSPLDDILVGLPAPVLRRIDPDADSFGPLEAAPLHALALAILPLFLCLLSTASGSNCCPHPRHCTHNSILSLRLSLSESASGSESRSLCLSLALAPS